jgi:predicted nucleotidyltransferase
MTPELTKILTQLREELSRALPDNLQQVTLYGSYARGDARSDSDVDLLIVLRHADETAQETVHQIAYQLMWNNDFQYVLTLNIIDAGHYSLLSDRQSSYYNNIVREGKALWPVT